MRQKTALVPAEKAKGFFLIRKRTVPPIFFRNQVVQVFMFGLRWNGHIQTLIKLRLKKPTHWNAEHRLGEMKSD